MIDRIAQVFDYAAFLTSAPMSNKDRRARQEIARDRAVEVLEIVRCPGKGAVAAAGDRWARVAYGDLDDLLYDEEAIEAAIDGAIEHMLNEGKGRG